MIRKSVIGLAIVIFFFLIPAVFHVFNYSQSIKLEQKKIIYNLPYPGLLPDSPLYFAKAGRDQILYFFTRDALKKAQLALLLSDKRVNAAQMLAKKGRNQLAISTASKAEKYALKIPQLLSQSKSQGAAADSAFVTRVRQSNIKHHEILNELLKTLPQGDTKGLDEVFKLNEEVRILMEKL